MKSGKILIFNPYEHATGYDLFKIISQNTEHQVLVMDQSHFSANTINYDPHLIFIIFSSCKTTEDEQIFALFLNRFSLTPAIAVLDCQYVCLDCPILCKRVWSFITTPLNNRDILLNIQKFLPYSGTKNIENYDTFIKQQTGAELLKGESRALQRVKESISQIAPYDVTVLLQGETGTGKELCARMIHFLSHRSDQSFIPINCGAIPNDLFENELFGHKKGAFTHASDRQTGLVDSANGGTLFLDEIESLPLLTQVKLLRFLEEKKYKPLGQAEYINVDVRIIAAAKENIWELVQEKKFREDLYYRLQVVQIQLEPLRNHSEDIPVLVDHFLKRFTILYNKKFKGITPPAMMKLLQYNWPGNVRELENVIRGLIIMNTTEWIEMDDIKLNQPAQLTSPGLLPFKPAKEKAINDFEINYLINLMIANDGNISKAAKYAQKERSAFCRLLKKYNIDANRYRSGAQNGANLAMRF